MFNSFDDKVKYYIKKKSHDERVNKSLRRELIENRVKFEFSNKKQKQKQKVDFSRKGLHRGGYSDEVQS